MDHLLIVPDGSLGSLPLGLLVKYLGHVPEQELGDETIAVASRGLREEASKLLKTLSKYSGLEGKSQPAAATTRNSYASYREAQWLAQEYALTTLPSVSSLRSLRGGSSAASKAPDPFMGFGDPLLGSSSGTTRMADASTLFSRGAVADVDKVRSLPRLPETAQELQTIARALGAPPEAVFLREEATESKVKSLDLAQARILAFATHGMVSGELKGQAEPALVFTPPEAGSAEDDGLLTASEVAQLKLDADWVILSACNTASADGSPGAEGLSGLARSFFYAGARSLLVSHWPVETNSAAELTTGIFEEMKANPEIGRAEALRRSRIRLINNPEYPEYAHPFFWAPFFVVGEGGPIQTPN